MEYKQFNANEPPSDFTSLTLQTTTRYENDTKFLSVYEVTYKCKLYKYYKLMVRCLSTPFHEELARWEVNEKKFFCKELHTWGELLMNTVE